MSRRILFLVNGLGLGNSTRCHAVIQHLAGQGAEIEVVTSDNGMWFFGDKPEIAGLTEVPSLRYGAAEGRISVLRTLGLAGQFWRALRRSEATIAAVMGRFRPQVVVTDSVYGLGPPWRARLPIVALNNADMVVRGLCRFTDWPAAVLPQFLCVEAGDALFHRVFPDLVISPRLDPADGAGGRTIRRVGPIVRRDCFAAGAADDAAVAGAGGGLRVVIMLSGSVFGSPVVLTRPHPGVTIDVVGRPAPVGRQPAAGVTYHGKLRDSLSLLRQADLVVVNGGFSAVSEAVALQKPVVVIPVPRHAEQWVNGRTVRHLGIGLTADEAALETTMEEALARLADFRAAYRRLPPAEDGAAQAAEMILAAGDRRNAGGRR